MAGALLGVYRAKPEVLWSYPLVAGIFFLAMGLFFVPLYQLGNGCPPPKIKEAR